MARPILDYTAKSRPKAGKCCGGVTMKDKVDVNNYRPPAGPTSIGNRQVGLGGTVYMQGTQEAGLRVRESGSPGLGGRNKGMGVNRKG